jgi:hypothetical protein
LSKVSDFQTCFSKNSKHSLADKLANKGQQRAASARSYVAETRSDLQMTGGSSTQMWNLISNTTQPPPLFPECDIKPFQPAPVFPKGFWSSTSTTTNNNTATTPASTLAPAPIPTLGLAWAESEEGERFMLKASRSLTDATSSSPFNLDKGITEGNVSGIEEFTAIGASDVHFIKNAVAAGRRLFNYIDDAVLFSEVFPRELVLSHAIMQQKKMTRKRSAKEAHIGSGGIRSGKGERSKKSTNTRERSDSMAASEVSVGAGELEPDSAVALLKLNNQLGEGGDDDLDENEEDDEDKDDGLGDLDEEDEGEDYNDYAQGNQDDDEEGGDDGGDG